MNNLSMRAYWGAREESREGCAQRLSAFMGDLTALHPRLSGWGEASGSPKKPRILFEPTSDGIAAVLTAGEKDFPRGEPWPEIGFMLICYTETGPEENVVEMNASLGAFTSHGSNHIALRMRNPVIVDAKLWTSIVLSAINRFNPDDAVVNNSAYFQRHGGDPRTAGGWFTYKKGEELIQHPAFLDECE